MSGTMAAKKGTEEREEKERDRGNGKGKKGTEEREEKE